MVKKCLFFLLFLLLLNTYAQDKEFSIIGKWQKTAKSGSDGAHDFTIEIVNGEVLFFQKQNSVTDGFGNVGTYYFEGEKYSGAKLKVVFKKSTNYYIVYFDVKNPDEMNLTPVTSDYSIICDEGCSFTYTRKKTN
jgi:hypothetical protein